MSDALAALGQLEGRIKAAAEQGLTEGLMALQAAALDLTPLGETGNLRGSSTIGPVLITHAGFAAELAYKIVYARYQHEGYGFNFTEPGTGAGFLDRAAQENAQNIRTILTNHIEGMIR